MVIIILNHYRFFDVNVKNFHRAKDDSDATLEIFLKLLNLQSELGHFNKIIFQRFSQFKIDSFKKFAPYEISKHFVGLGENKIEK